MYWPIFGMSSTCDWTCRANSRSTLSRSARIGSKICDRASEDFCTAAQVETLSRAEQGVEVRHYLRRKVDRIPSVHVGECTHDSGDVGRLVALAAVRHRRQKRTIGFDEQPIERHAARRVA